jgi:hypothetical protein
LGDGKSIAKSIAKVVDEGVREYDETRFWKDDEAGYAALAANPIAAGELERETRAWDVTLADGLEKPHHARTKPTRRLARTGDVDSPS